MSGDLIIGSRSLLNYLIKGSGSFTGLQDRMTIATPPAADHKVPKVQPRYSYDPTTRGLVQLESPLPQPYVTLLVTTRVKQPSFYKRDRHPTEDVFAWVRRFNMQWDIWGRTPVEVDYITDQIEEICVQMNNDLWDQSRIALSIGEFEDAQLEIETGIYRAIARGYCQTAHIAAA